MQPTLILKPEEELLLYCSRTNMDLETELRVKFLSEKLDWQYLVQISSIHGLNPLLYSNLIKLVPDKIPKGIIKDLKDYYMNNAHKNLLMFRELRKIIEKFDENGIKVIPYKGPILTIMAYNDLSLREFSDIDLYINLKDISKVKKIMPLLRYESIFQLEKHQEAVYFKFQREYQFINRLNHVLVEIKWKLFIPSFSFWINPDPFFTSKTQILDLSNMNIETISAENLLLLLSIHNAGHYWSALSRICDISHLISSQKVFDWNRIVQKASVLGFKRVLYINLLLAQNLFGLQLPDEVSLKLNVDENANAIANWIQHNFFFTNKKLKGYEKVYLRVRIREKKINKIQDFFKLIFNPTIDVVVSTSLPYFLYPVYYFLRIFQIFKKYIKP